MYIYPQWLTLRLSFLSVVIVDKCFQLLFKFVVISVSKHIKVLLKVLASCRFCFDFTHSQKKKRKRFAKSGQSGMLIVCLKILFPTWIIMIGNAMFPHRDSAIYHIIPSLLRSRCLAPLFLYASLMRWPMLGRGKSCGMFV